MSTPKGSIPWNKGKKGAQVAWNKGLKGVSSGGFIKGHTINLGTTRTPLTADHKQRIALTLRGRRQPWHEGEKSNLWKGGASTASAKFKSSIEYRAWRRMVFERDDYTCVLCAQRGRYLEADHIKPKAIYPELALELSNGRTLCKPCHRKTDTFGIKTYHMKYAA